MLVPLMESWHQSERCLFVKSSWDNSRDRKSSKQPKNTLTANVEARNQNLFAPHKPLQTHPGPPVEYSL